MREHVPLELSEEGEAMFPWLPEYMKTDVDRLATMLLCSRIVAFTDKGGLLIATALSPVGMERSAGFGPAPPGGWPGVLR